jgi:hypothetical protein
LCISIFGFLAFAFIADAASRFYQIVASEGPSETRPASLFKIIKDRVTARRESSSASSRPTNYAAIARRNLFQTIVPPKIIASPPMVGVPQPVKRFAARPALQTHTAHVIQPDSALINRNPPPVREIRYLMQDKIVLVGIVQVNNDWQALIEDGASGATRHVQTGEFAFGYLVQAVNAASVVLERDGNLYLANMGEKKVTPSPRESLPEVED